jgi:hypothetical protein
MHVFSFPIWKSLSQPSTIGLRLLPGLTLKPLESQNKIKISIKKFFTWSNYHTDEDAMEGNISSLFTSIISHTRHEATNFVQQENYFFVLSA